MKSASDYLELPSDEVVLAALGSYGLPGSIAASRMDAAVAWWCRTQCCAARGTSATLQESAGDNEDAVSDRGVRGDDR